MLSPQQAKKLAALLPTLPEEERARLMELLDELGKRKKVERCQTSFLDFVREMWPGFIAGKHHRIMADTFERVARGELKRVIINMAPRHTKSEFASFLLPAWFLGLHPDRKIIQSSHTAELATGFGRKVRNLVDSDPYRSVFSEVHLQSDSKAAGRWNTNKGGEYFAIGVGGAVAGKGGDVVIIDDPHSEQEAKLGDPAVFDSVFEWYQTGPRQRLQPGGAIIIVMTRWSTRDLTGRLIQEQSKNPEADQWELIEFPAILPNGQSLWPEFWSIEELLKTKASIVPRYWQAQYQQNPTAEESAIVKREWWREWTAEDPPACEFVIQSWDTAFEKNNRADYSACTTWGVFYPEGERGEEGAQAAPNVVLLDAFKDRMEFPELKEVAKRHYDAWQPDAFVVEKKAAGAPLIYELRKMGIPVAEFTPSRGNDKIARLNAVSDLFSSGVVWAPATRWAQEVIEEVASFPAGDHDDYVDSTSQALLRFRKGGFVRLPSDEPDEPRRHRRRGRGYY